MSNEEVRDLSSRIDIRALKTYRLAVARQTRKIVANLKSEYYLQKVESSRLQRIWDEKAMLPNAPGIVSYWGSRTIAGLLMMPPTRHCFLHLSEARQIRSKVVREAK